MTAHEPQHVKPRPRLAATHPAKESTPRPPHCWNRCDFSQAPHRPGCYAIFRGPVLVYIGSAKNIRVRLQHQGIGNRWQLAHTRFGPLCELQLRIAINRRRWQHATRELRLVERLRPQVNVQHAAPPIQR